MADSADKTVSVLIKEKAFEFGFDICGIAPSRPLEERKNILQSWCNEGMNAGMNYLSRDIDKRTDPRSLVPDARSLIVTGLNYYTDKKQKKPGVPVLSRYAYGESYHTVIERKLDKLFSYIRNLIPGTEGRLFVDSAPLLEKA